MTSPHVTTDEFVSKERNRLFNALMAEYGLSIRNARLAKNLRQRDVAARCGVSVALVERWETGLELPQGRRWKRLRGVFPTIIATAKFNQLVEETTRLVDEHPQVRFPDEAFHRLVLEGHAVAEPDVDDEPIEPTPAPAALPKGAWPDGNIDVPTTFGAALVRCRTVERVSQVFVAELVDVTQSTVSSWEREETLPVTDNYERLCELFPQLLQLATPDCLDRPKPVGPLGLKFGTPPARGPDSGPRVSVPLSEPADLGPPASTRKQPPALPDLAPSMGPISCLLALLQGLKGDAASQITFERSADGWMMTIWGSGESVIARWGGPDARQSPDHAVAEATRHAVDTLRERREELDRLARLVGL